MDNIIAEAEERVDELEVQVKEAQGRYNKAVEDQQTVDALLASVRHEHIIASKDEKERKKAVVESTEKAVTAAKKVVESNNKTLETTKAQLEEARSMLAELLKDDNEEEENIGEEKEDVKEGVAPLEKMDRGDEDILESKEGNSLVIREQEVFSLTINTDSVVDGDMSSPRSPSRNTMSKAERKKHKDEQKQQKAAAAAVKFMKMGEEIRNLQKQEEEDRIKAAEEAKAAKKLQEDNARARPVVDKWKGLVKRREDNEEQKENEEEVKLGELEDNIPSNGLVREESYSEYMNDIPFGVAVGEMPVIDAVVTGISRITENMHIGYNFLFGENNDNYEVHYMNNVIYDDPEFVSSIHRQALAKINAKKAAANQPKALEEVEVYKDEYVETITKIKEIIGEDTLSSLVDFHQHMSTSKVMTKMVDSVSDLFHRFTNLVDVAIAIKGVDKEAEDEVAFETAMTLSKIAEILSIIISGPIFVGVPPRAYDFNPEDFSSPYGDGSSNRGCGEGGIKDDLFMVLVGNPTNTTAYEADV